MFSMKKMGCSRDFRITEQKIIAAVITKVKNELQKTCEQLDQPLSTDNAENVGLMPLQGEFRQRKPLFAGGSRNESEGLLRLLPLGSPAEFRPLIRDSPQFLPKNCR